MEDQSKCSTTESICQNRNRLTIQKFHMRHMCNGLYTDEHFW